MVEYDTRVKYLKGVGEARSKELSKLGIFSVGSLLRFYPRAYEDWSKITKIKDAPVGENLCFSAEVLDRVHDIKISGGRLLSKTVISDGSGYVPLVFFNNKYISDTLKEGSEYLFFGKLSRDKNGEVSMLAPRVEKPEKQRIRPIYKASSKISLRLASASAFSLSGK